MKRVILPLLAASATAWAVPPVIDGANIPTEFGTALIYQDTNTRFGDNGNEMNGLFARFEGANLYVGIPGNLADNNAVTLFIDTTPGNAPALETLNTEPGGPCPGTVPTLLRILSGTRMDPGFDPSYALTISVGTFPGLGVGSEKWVYACDLTNLATLANVSLGIGAVNTGNGQLTGNSGVQVSLNNSNTAGVSCWTQFPDPNDPCPGPLAEPGAAETATSGIEISIPRSLIGNPGSGSTVNLFALLTNNAQDGGGPPGQIPGACNRFGFSSNQALPGLAGNDNLATFTPGGPFRLDFTGFQGPGTQFIGVSVP